MKAIKVAPMKTPVEIDINNTLETLQHEVDGYIEVCYPFEDNVCIVLNEEGKLGGYEPNRAIMDGNEIIDIIFGTFIIVGINDEGEFIPLTDEQTKTYMKMYARPEMFFSMGGKVHRVFRE